MTANIEKLINTFEEYYNSKHNYEKATLLLESLCFACGVSPNFPRYWRFNDITAWYEAVVSWLFAVRILQ